VFWDQSGVERECARGPDFGRAILQGDLPLYHNCIFFARKFRGQTAEAVHKLLSDLYII
jgi:hypothetical protein